MLGWFHTLLVLFYALLPLGALLWTFRQVYRRPSSLEPLGILLTGMIGATVGVSGALIYARQTNGTVSLAQVLLAIWFATALLLLLKLGDRLLTRLLRPLLFRRDQHALRPPPMPAAVGAFILRVAVLFTVAIPLVAGSLLVYRPRVRHLQTPAAAGFAYQPVTLATDDGLLLRAWWIPAQAIDQRDLQPSDRTVILCHGFGASAEGALPLAEQLVPYGYNVLMFDFRAHGFSEGQLTGFGALEKNDVLAAVQWVRHHHPDESAHLFGAGIGLGAAALVNAAADKTPDARAIQSLVLYAPYASPAGLIDEMISHRLPRPLRWMVLNIAIPLASLTAGADLQQQSPARQITNVWPRPVLIIHGLRDNLIPFSQGEALFDLTPQPHQRLWLLGADHAQTLRDPDAALRMRHFFQTARPVPII